MSSKLLGRLIDLWHDVGYELCYEMGAEIHGLRSKLGWTKEETAEQSGLTVEVVDAIENSDITINKDIYLTVIFMLETMIEKQMNSPGLGLSQ